MHSTTLPAPERSPRNLLRLDLTARVAIAVAVLAAEKLSLGLLGDRPPDVAPQAVANPLVDAQHWLSGTLVAFALLLAGLLYGARDERWQAASHAVRGQPFSRRALQGHVLCLLLLGFLTPRLFVPEALGLPPYVRVLLWAAAVVGVALTALGSVAPWPALRSALRTLRPYWPPAALAAALGAAAVSLSQRLWAPAASLTFELVRGLLAPWIGSLRTDAANRILATDGFAVQVSDACSGLEGVGMMLALCGAWLLVFRREYLLRRAWVLLPAGVVLVFAVNVVRIAALVAIGHAGHAQIAVSGFHSQAGWIAFNTVSLGMLYASRRSAWMNLQARAERQAALAGDAAPAAAVPADNVTAAYLLPLLAILATGMLTAAVSGGFDRFYGLRWIAALAVLWHYRARLASLDWRCSWRGPAVGVAVFALWLFASRLQSAPASMPAGLASLSPSARTLWIAVRALAATTTVPVAEELAYRGFLMRRFVTPRFETLPFTAVGLPAVLSSALVFGVVHGSLWLPGCVAGVAYGLLAQRTGRLGEAVAAHAVTNALLAATVLGAQQWQLW